MHSRGPSQPQAPRDGGGQRLFAERGAARCAQSPRLCGAGTRPAPGLLWGRRRRPRPPRPGPGSARPCSRNRVPRQRRAARGVRAPVCGSAAATFRGAPRAGLLLEGLRRQVEPGQRENGAPAPPPAPHEPCGPRRGAPGERSMARFPYGGGSAMLARCLRWLRHSCGRCKEGWGNCGAAYAALPAALGGFGGYTLPCCTAGPLAAPRGPPGCEAAAAVWGGGRVPPDRRGGTLSAGAGCPGGAGRGHSHRGGNGVAPRAERPRTGRFPPLLPPPWAAPGFGGFLAGGLPSLTASLPLPQPCPPPKPCRSRPPARGRRARGLEKPPHGCASPSCPRTPSPRPGAPRGLRATICTGEGGWGYGTRGGSSAPLGEPWARGSSGWEGPRGCLPSWVPGQSRWPCRRGGQSWSSCSSPAPPSLSIFGYLWSSHVTA